MLKFDSTQLRSRLEKLSPEERSIFALGIAKRLAQAKGNKSFEDVLTTYEEILLNKDNEELDEDDLASFFSAISTIARDDNIDMTLATAGRAYESVDSAAQDELKIEAFDTETEKQLLESKVVQEELAAQEASLSELEKNN